MHASRVSTIPRLFLFLLLLAAAGGCGGGGWPEPDDSEPGKLRQQMLEQLEAGASVADILATARQRQALLRTGWDEGTSYGDGALFPPEERALFPRAVRFLIEQPVDLDANVRMTIADGEEGSTVDYALAGPLGTHHIVGLSQEQLVALVDSKVHVRGWLTDRFVWAPEWTPATGDGIGTAQQALVTGTKHVLVIMAQMSDTQPSDLWTEEIIEQRMITDEDSSAAFFEQASRDDVTLELARVGGVYSVYEQAEADNCDYNAWATRLRAAAQNDGIDPNDYDHIVFAMPTVGTNCFWSGLAYVGGDTSWLRSTSARTMSHEFGHNFGLLHAGAISCDDEPLPATVNDPACDHDAVSDPNDVMAYTSYRQLNGPHQIELGWLPEAEIIDITAEGSHTLRPLHGPGGGTRALRFHAPGPSRDVIISYRDRLAPFDENVQGGEEGVEIHFNSIWDADPQRRSDTQRVAQLRDGETFYDGLSGLSLRQIGHSATSATLEVSILPRTRLEVDDEAELVEDVAVGGVSNDMRSVLNLYHQPTGLTPMSDNPAYTQVGRQHTRLMARIARGHQLSPGNWQQLDAQPIAAVEPPTNFAVRVERHAAAAFDPNRNSFVVVSSRRADHTQAGDGSDIHYSLHIAEMDAETGAVSDHGRVDLGPSWVDCSGSSCINPLIRTDANVDLVRTQSGFVMVVGHGGNTLNVHGKPLLIGRFSLDNAPFATPADLNLRALPASSKAKWPQLTTGDGIVAISWTQAYGAYPSNRIAVLGYNDATDTIIAPNQAAVSFAASASVSPLIVSETIAAPSGYNAFRPHTSYDPVSQRFTSAFTYSGELFNWEVVARSFQLAASQLPALSEIHHLSSYDAKWSYSAQIDTANMAGGPVAAYQEDDLDFFDGLARIRIDYYDANIERRGSTLLAPDETEIGGIRMATDATSPWVFITHSNSAGIRMNAVRWGN